MVGILADTDNNGNLTAAKSAKVENVTMNGAVDVKLPSVNVPADADDYENYAFGAGGITGYAKLESKNQKSVILSCQNHAGVSGNYMTGGIVLNHNLFPVYLNITGTTPGVPSAYVLAKGNSADTASDTTTDTADTSDTDSSDTTDSSDSTDAAQEESTAAAKVSYVNTTSVDVTIQGSETEIRAFLDDIANDYPGIQVTSFTMQENEYVNSSL